MVAQMNMTPPVFVPQKLRAAKTEVLWTAIETYLAGRSSAVTSDIAAAIGLTASSTSARLDELRELGIVRRVPHMTYRGNLSTKKAWALGMEDYVARAESMRPNMVKAQQLGCFSRDPLVAALFGAGHNHSIGG